MGEASLRHLLPYIAYRIEKGQDHDRLAFSITELKRFLKDYNELFKINRDVSDDLSSLEKAFDAFFDDKYRHDALTKQCCNVYGILKTDNNKTYSFSHQHFRDMFSAAHIRNQMKLNDKEVFTERIFPFHISRMLLEILQEHKYVPKR